MITLKSTRYFTNGDVEVAHALTFDVLNNDLDNARKAVSNHLNFDVDLPPMDGPEPWREMTDEEARDYQKRQGDEDEEARQHRLNTAYEDDE